MRLLKFFGLATETTTTTTLLSPLEILASSIRIWGKSKKQESTSISGKRFLRTCTDRIVQTINTLINNYLDIRCIHKQNFISIQFSASRADFFTSIDKYIGNLYNKYSFSKWTRKDSHSGYRTNPSLEPKLIVELRLKKKALIYLQ